MAPARWLACGLVVLLPFAASPQLSAAVPDRGSLEFDTLPGARFDFPGPEGERIANNTQHWLLQAPQANPGMLEMFRIRDRKPVPQLVPWAGEFVGKYLISGIQALRITDPTLLFQQLSNTVADLIATQAEDGYLGPFPRDIRLLRNWDLWGHYHAIEALLLWHQATGDPAALAAARRAGDLVCRTYLDTGRRVFDAGDHEMNMAILTALVHLHRRTGDPTYLRMAREVEKDWERAGDYLRAGLDGREFFQSPRPRWESLHDLQGLVELWRVTGEEKYRESFIHHWRSIRRWDRRNTGGFSSGEQATGNPYAPTAIETCCTVAWMALTLDYLRLTGDARAADELELSTFNGGLGAQHPSGRWWTYNTPMDGVREASAHTIVFQARAGTPELNCCSVNGPRILGMLGEWAVMRARDGLVLNWLGTLNASAPLADGTPVHLVTYPPNPGNLHIHYPVDPRVRIHVRPAVAREFTLHLRIPAWMTRPQLKVGAGDAPPLHPTPGRYVAIRRTWSPEDVIEITLTEDSPIRYVPGAGEAAGKVSLYRGPLLLAYDPRFNAFDEEDLPPVALDRLTAAQVTPPAPPGTRAEIAPWIQVSVPSADPARPLRLVDFATAGATGTRYRSWLPTAPSATPPEPVFTQFPRDGSRVRPGPTWFRWRGPRLPEQASPTASGYRVQIGTNDTVEPAFETSLTRSNRLLVDTAKLHSRFPAAGTFYWRVAHARGSAVTMADVPPGRFLLDPGAPPDVTPPEPAIGPQGEIIEHAMRAADRPRFGDLAPGSVLPRHPDGITLDGVRQMLVYPLTAWPEDDFTVAVRVLIRQLPEGRIGQVFSAWSAPMDDPLRLVIDRGRLHARIEAGAGYSTPGVDIATGRWHRILAVRRAGTLTVYLDGRPAGSCVVPEWLPAQSTACALGGNPRYPGNEFLAATFSDFLLLDRALTPQEAERWGAEATSPQGQTP